MNEQDASVDSRRRTGRKPYPVLTFESALELARAINQHGIDGSIRRLTLFLELNRSPGSGTSRLLISTSAKYGLTSGNYNAEFLELTDAGRTMAEGDPSSNRQTLEIAFRQAISTTPAFDAVYHQLKNKRLPLPSVLQDLLSQEGINEGDVEEAGIIFTENVRYLGLIQEQAGSEYIIPLEQRIEDFAASDETTAINDAGDSTNYQLDEQSVAVPAVSPSNSVTHGPSLHIDIQIHIDSTATSDQIDHIFSSMARHLYGRKE